MAFDRYNELQLLEALEREPETTQADLARQLGVAVGTVNWYLKRWSAKGYIKVKRIDRWRWRYLLTTQGVKEKATLAKKYVDASLHVYRETRERTVVLLEQVVEAGHSQTYIDGDGELAEIVALSCLEKGVLVLSTRSAAAPVIRVRPLEMTLILPLDDGPEERY